MWGLGTRSAITLKQKMYLHQTGFQKKAEKTLNHFGPTTRFARPRKTVCFGESTEKYRDAVKDDCHVTGKFRGAACNSCNLKLRLKPKEVKILVICHDLSGSYGSAFNAEHHKDSRQVEIHPR